MSPSSLAAALTGILSVIAVSNLIPIAAAQDSTQTEPAEAPAKPEPDASQPATSPKDAGKQQVHEEEKQRILAVLPNFQTANRQTAVPLTAGQKFHLAVRQAIDPFQFALAGIDAGISQAGDKFSGYGLGAEGYAKRFGAAYADQISGTMWGNAIYPSLLHQDPRYLRKETGTFKHRLVDSLVATFWTRNDNGTWGPNYSNVAGDFTAGALANIYYPASNRGFGLTMQRTATIAIEGALADILKEFWPDIDA
ncbi:MAG TPA: hypothetical protein VGK48_25215, partial [Terriglobia bacterium]